MDEGWPKPVFGQPALYSVGTKRFYYHISVSSTLIIEDKNNTVQAEWRVRTCLGVEKTFPFIGGVETVFTLETGTEAHMMSQLELSLKAFSSIDGAYFFV